MEFNRFIPELSVTDIQKSLRFYIDTLGFRIEYRRDEAKFVFMSFQGSQLMLEQRNGNWETGVLEHPFGRGINFQVFVDRLEPVLEALRRVGYPLYKEPFESRYQCGSEQVGQREFLVQDPDGYLLRFAERIA